MSAPSWLLLAWVGAAATCAAALTGTLLAGRTRMAWALVPRPRSAAHALRATMLAGMVAYPIIYGVIFEAIQRSDVAVGFILGSVHAIIGFAFSRPGVQPGTAFRMAAMHLAYGTACALLYVTP
jgi:hypothetical protein